MKLVIGLGNVGKSYENTRHNLGFMVLDHLAEINRVAFRNPPRVNGEIARLGEAILAKPATFMNLSGDFVQRMIQFYKVAIEDVLIIYDDMSLNVGEALLKPSGSAAGHKGLIDIFQKVGTSNMARLKIGIGLPSQKGDSAKHVLSDFTKEEREKIHAQLPDIVEAVNLFISGDLNAAMKRLNTKPES